MAPECAKIGQERTCVMIAPHINALADQAPEPASDHCVFLVHMHEHRVVTSAKRPHEPEEAPCVNHALCKRRAVQSVLAKRMDRDIRRERMPPFRKTNRFYGFKLPRKASDPVMVRTMDRIIEIQGLGDNEKAHRSMVTRPRIGSLASGHPLASHRGASQRGACLDTPEPSLQVPSRDHR